MSAEINKAIRFDFYLSEPMSLLKCPYCSAALNRNLAFAGHVFECPKCNQDVTMPPDSLADYDAMPLDLLTAYEDAVYQSNEEDTLKESIGDPIAHDEEVIDGGELEDRLFLTPEEEAKKPFNQIPDSRAEVNATNFDTSMFYKIKTPKAVFDRYEAALAAMENHAVEIVAGFQSAFPAAEMQHYKFRPTDFVAEMVALFIWRFLTDTQVPEYRENVFVPMAIRRLGPRVSDHWDTPAVWCRYFHYGHEILFEQRTLGILVPRRRPVSGSWEVPADVICHLDEASDLLIAAWKSSQRSRSTIVLDTVRNSLWTIACALAFSDGVIQLHDANALNAVQRGLQDLPPKCFAEVERGRKKNQKRPLSAILAELNEMVGLHDVKENIANVIHFDDFQRKRQLLGKKKLAISRHLVFTGNPGTGKTVVARLLAEAYAAIGLLKKGQLIEVGREKLVGGFIGQTAIKTQEVIRSALGGVLFIDEAYSLVKRGSGNDYGSEAIETLLAMMENHRDELVVIVAGYPELMERFIESNPGLASRFSRTIEFSDFSVAELTEIFCRLVVSQEYELEPGVETGLKLLFGRLKEASGPLFGNARTVRKLFEQTLMTHASRLGRESIVSTNALNRIQATDIEKAAEIIRS